MEHIGIDAPAEGVGSHRFDTCRRLCNKFDVGFTGQMRRSEIDVVGPQRR